MNDRIVRISEFLLRFFRPSPGRDWVPVRPPIVECADVQTLAPPRVWVPLLLSGEDTVSVRPYLVACEQQGERRRALFLAVHGIDAGPLVIHGVVVGR